ncbi:hypothetical protein HIM_09924 [Hirsutella minnesotensis 3608]|uniref:Uncharacterized protein n=1 Tax=Hirsutella minnesotensis 3608 TaxID=1043627 RepID=A0A0F7ZKQ8_9HYPO|nr:hypothetical protein HIM_09924 [Hirsutella minnesotensis 3608]
MSNPDLSMSAFSGSIAQDDVMRFSSQAQEGTASLSGDLRSTRCQILSPSCRLIASAHQSGGRENHSPPLPSTPEPRNVYHQPQHTHYRPFDAPEPSFDDSDYPQGLLQDEDELVDEKIRDTNFAYIDLAVCDEGYSTANDQGSPTVSHRSVEETCMDCTCIREILNQSLDDFPLSTSELSPAGFMDLCDESPDFGNPYDDELSFIDLTDETDDDELMVIDLTEDSWSNTSANEESRGENPIQVISDFVIVGESLCPVYKYHGVDFIDLTLL